MQETAAVLETSSGGLVLYLTLISLVHQLLMGDRRPPPFHRLGGRRGARTHTGAGVASFPSPQGGRRLQRWRQRQHGDRRRVATHATAATAAAVRRMESGGTVHQPGRRKLMHTHRRREISLLLAGRGGQGVKGGQGLEKLQLRRLRRLGVVEGVGRDERDGDAIGGLLVMVVGVLGVMLQAVQQQRAPWL